LAETRIPAGHGYAKLAVQDTRLLLLGILDHLPVGAAIESLRSRLRRGLLCAPLTCRNKFPHTMIGGLSEAVRLAQTAGFMRDGPLAVTVETISWNSVRVDASCLPSLRSTRRRTSASGTPTGI
jgi:hypothetical protein